MRVQAISDRLSARRLALQGYSQGVSAPGSRRSLDTASRKSLGGRKSTELVSQRALPAIPSEGNFMATGGNATANGHTSVKEMDPTGSSGPLLCFFFSDPGAVIPGYPSA